MDIMGGNRERKQQDLCGSTKVASMADQFGNHPVYSNMPIAELLRRRDEMTDEAYGPSAENPGLVMDLDGASCSRSDRPAPANEPMGDGSAGAGGRRDLNPSAVPEGGSLGRSDRSVPANERSTEFVPARWPGRSLLSLEGDEPTPTFRDTRDAVVVAADEVAGDSGSTPGRVRTRSAVMANARPVDIDPFDTDDGFGADYEPFAPPRGSNIMHKGYSPYSLSELNKDSPNGMDSDSDEKLHLNYYYPTLFNTVKAPERDYSQKLYGIDRISNNEKMLNLKKRDYPVKGNPTAQVKEVYPVKTVMEAPVSIDADSISIDEPPSLVWRRRRKRQKLVEEGDAVKEAESNADEGAANFLHYQLEKLKAKVKREFDDFERKAREDGEAEVKQDDESALTKRQLRSLTGNVAKKGVSKVKRAQEADQTEGQLRSLSKNVAKEVKPMVKRELENKRRYNTALFEYKNRLVKRSSARRPSANRRAAEGADPGVLTSKANAIQTVNEPEEDLINPQLKAVENVLPNRKLTERKRNLEHVNNELALMSGNWFGSPTMKDRWKKESSSRQDGVWSAKRSEGSSQSLADAEDSVRSNIQKNEIGIQKLKAELDDLFKSINVSKEDNIIPSYKGFWKHRLDRMGSPHPKSATKYHTPQAYMSSAESRVTGGEESEADPMSEERPSERHGGAGDNSEEEGDSEEEGGGDAEMEGPPLGWPRSRRLLSTTAEEEPSSPKGEGGGGGKRDTMSSEGEDTQRGDVVRESGRLRQRDENPGSSDESVGENGVAQTDKKEKTDALRTGRNLKGTMKRKNSNSLDSVVENGVDPLSQGISGNNNEQDDNKDAGTKLAITNSAHKSIPGIGDGFSERSQQEVGAFTKTKSNPLDKGCSLLQAFWGKEGVEESERASPEHLSERPGQLEGANAEEWRMDRSEREKVNGTVAEDNEPKSARDDDQLALDLIDNIRSLLGGEGSKVVYQPVVDWQAGDRERFEQLKHHRRHGPSFEEDAEDAAPSSETANLVPSPSNNNWRSDRSHMDGDNLAERQRLFELLQLPEDKLRLETPGAEDLGDLEVSVLGTFLKKRKRKKKKDNSERGSTAGEPRSVIRKRDLEAADDGNEYKYNGLDPRFRYPHRRDAGQSRGRIPVYKLPSADIFRRWDLEDDVHAFSNSLFVGLQPQHQEFAGFDSEGNYVSPTNLDIEPHSRCRRRRRRHARGHRDALLFARQDPVEDFFRNRRRVPLRAVNVVERRRDAQGWPVDATANASDAALGSPTLLLAVAFACILRYHPGQAGSHSHRAVC